VKAQHQLHVFRLTILLEHVKVVYLAQVGQTLRESSDFGLIIEYSLSPVGAEADVVVKLESPRDFFERLELHGASIREQNRRRQ